MVPDNRGVCPCCRLLLLPRDEKVRELIVRQLSFQHSARPGGREASLFQRKDVRQHIRCRWDNLKLRKHHVPLTFPADTTADGCEPIARQSWFQPAAGVSQRAKRLLTVRIEFPLRPAGRTAAQPDLRRFHLVEVVPSRYARLE